MTITTTTIDHTKVHDFLRGLGGKMFSVDWITKNGRVRTLNGRLGVHCYAKGGTNKAVHSGTPYIPVWESIKPQDEDRDGRRNYRLLNLSSIDRIRAKGREYRVR